MSLSMTMLITGFENVTNLMSNTMRALAETPIRPERNSSRVQRPGLPLRRPIKNLVG
jgi:cytochrome P450